MSGDFMEMQAVKKKKSWESSCKFPRWFAFACMRDPTAPPPVVRMQPNDFLLRGPEVNAGGGEEDGGRALRWLNTNAAPGSPGDAAFHQKSHPSSGTEQRAERLRFRLMQRRSSRQQQPCKYRTC